MSRNVTILVVILIIVLLAGYLVWLRNRFMMNNNIGELPAQITVTPALTLTPTIMASPTATVSASPTRRVSATPTPRGGAATRSGSVR